jgi:hypothetical protein
MTLKDAVRAGAELAVGLGVLGVRRAVASNPTLPLNALSAASRIAFNVAELRRELAHRAEELERLAQPVASLVAPALDQVEELLPPPARQVARRGREVAQGAIAQVWSILKDAA